MSFQLPKLRILNFLQDTKENTWLTAKEIFISEDDS